MVNLYALCFAKFGCNISYHGYAVYGRARVPVVADGEGTNVILELITLEEVRASHTTSTHDHLLLDWELMTRTGHHAPNME